MNVELKFLTLFRRGQFAAFVVSFSLLTVFLLCMPAVASELILAVSSGSGMPMTDIRGDELQAGILKEFGDALSMQLQREPRYLILPRTRVEGALLRGKADLVCDLRPEWLDNQSFLWSEAIISNRMMVAMRRETPVPGSLADIAGMRVGTIRGYRYPEIERLRPAIVRDDAANDTLNLEKLLRGRFDFIVTNRIYFDYQRKMHPDRKRLAAHYLKITDFDTYCAIHPEGRITLQQLNQAIAALRARGTIQSILARYRPTDSHG